MNRKWFHPIKYTKTYNNTEKHRNIISSEFLIRHIKDWIIFKIIKWGLKWEGFNEIIFLWWLIEFPIQKSNIH